MKLVMKRIFPKRVSDSLLKIRELFNSKRNYFPTPPTGTDLVGYETLIDFIVSNDVLSVEGDLVDIGTFLGGGVYKLSKYLEIEKSSKLLYVVDIFDPTSDWTVNTDGKAMTTIYLDRLKQYVGKSQWEVFSDVIKGCNNVVVLRGDSKKIVLPTTKLCFGFIDGNHDPEYIENDFYLIWNKLSSRGVVAFHDYEYNLPHATKKINELVNRHALEISMTFHNPQKRILYSIKK
jgi:hypothetical protein